MLATIEVVAVIKKMEDGEYFYVVNAYYADGNWKSAGGGAPTVEGAKDMIQFVIETWGISMDDTGVDVEILEC